MAYRYIGSYEVKDRHARDWTTHRTVPFDTPAEAEQVARRLMRGYDSSSLMARGPFVERTDWKIPDNPTDEEWF